MKTPVIEVEARLNKEMLKEVLLGLEEIKRERELTPLEERLYRACAKHLGKEVRQENNN